MKTFWEIGLANALMVALATPVAYLLGRLFRRRPAWIHAVWVVVLLRLITPAAASIPIAWPRADVARAPAIAGGEPAETGLIADETPRSFPVGDGEGSQLSKVADNGQPWKWPSWGVVLGSIWLGGSALCGGIAIWRIARFSRVMKRAEAAPAEMVSWVGDLSERIGLRRSPRVVIAPGRVSPMVWALGGRAWLVVPEGLWARLGNEQRSAMLIHELAHLRRRDHWTRLLELVTTTLYWWHPALWLARRELHRAEEFCCDSWVVWALPQSKKNYAAALVEAVEFLSEAPPQKLPVGASGMGQVEDLSRRIGMILRGDAPRGVGRIGSIALIGLGLLLLPWKPTLATQQDTPKQPVALEATAGDVSDVDKLAKEVQDLLDKHSEAMKAGTSTAKEKSEMQKAYDRLKWSSQMLKMKYVPASAVRADLATLALAQEKKAQVDGLSAAGVGDEPESATKISNEAIAVAEEQLKLALASEARIRKLREAGSVSQSEVEEASVKVLEHRANLASIRSKLKQANDDRVSAIRGAEDEVEMARGRLDAQMAKVSQAEAQRKLALSNLSRMERLLQKDAGTVSSFEKEKAAAELEVANALVAEAKAQANLSQIGVRYAGRRLEALRTKPTTVDFTSEPANTHAREVRDPQKRIDELEKKLDRVLREIEEMRREQGGKPGTATRR